MTFTKLAYNIMSGTLAAMQSYIALLSEVFVPHKIILILHTHVSVRACSSCGPLLVTTKQKGCGR